MTATTTRYDRWMSAHGGHDLAHDTVEGHRLTLCRTCDELNCRDCGPDPSGRTEP